MNDEPAPVSRWDARRLERLRAAVAKILRAEHVADRFSFEEWRIRSLGCDQAESVEALLELVPEDAVLDWTREDLAVLLVPWWKNLFPRWKPVSWLLVTLFLLLADDAFVVPGLLPFNDWYAFPVVAWTAILGISWLWRASPRRHMAARRAGATMYLLRALRNERRRVLEAELEALEADVSSGAECRELSFHRALLSRDN